MKLVVVVGLLVSAAHARAQGTCVAKAAFDTEAAKLTAANTKARNGAFSAAGLTPITATVVSRGTSPKAPAGNVVVVELHEGCDEDAAATVMFVADKNGKAYRVVPAGPVSEAAYTVCGAPDCKPPCGIPSTHTKAWFKLPDKLVYSGDREVGWKSTIPRANYELRCDKNGHAVPASSATGATSSSRTPTSQVAPAPICPALPPAKTPADKLRRENAELRAENQRLKREMDTLLEAGKREIERLQRQQKQLSRDLK